MDKNNSLNSIVILIVDDNPGDVRLIREAFDRYKIANKLYSVGDGEQAMEFLTRKGDFKNSPRPDMILLDLNLPRKDGREVLAELKSNPHIKSIPVIILTSSDAETDVLNSYDLHANCYIKKPVDFDGLIRVVKSIKEFWLSIVKLPKKE